MEDTGWRLPEGLGADSDALRTSPRKRPARVVGRTVQACALAGLPGGTLGRAPRPSGLRGSTRGAVGPSPAPEDPDARRLGGGRPGVPRVPGKGGGCSPPGGFTCRRPRLRSHAPRGVPRSLLGSPRRLSQYTSAALMTGHLKKSEVTLGSLGGAENGQLYRGRRVTDR